ncbi:MAG TPA: ChbG/HpnK family deacetylase, partial [Tepidisphaeraceae bacterium]|nr:ChbG/HpnK family deacetylase [Tepidisphaeraceae bacterium]
MIVRAGDMGVCHTANEACLAAYRNGIVRSAEVIVPGQWFLEATKMLNETPGLRQLTQRLADEYKLPVNI